MGIWGKRPLRSAEYHIKVNVVGNSGVGKSSLLMTYFKGYHVPADMPTIYEQYNRMVRYGGWQIALSISDSSGMPLNSVVRRYNYKYTDVFILCYAVDDPNSFADLPKWAREIRSTVGYVPIVLVALKDDLKGDASIAEKLEWDGESIITFKDGKEMAKRLNVHSFCECSSLRSAVR
ncbi:Rho-related protein racG [Toxocara canis]|uniref:Rho-related protein racG n=1 Tax=Toxocara canis TaxID=6265 RepID=A0A0B2VW71_TOXCA|nr:Rho-related protein racG [Toxocara canis]